MPWSVTCVSVFVYKISLSRHIICVFNYSYYFIQVNMAETDITRMSSDYADNELELFRKTVRSFSVKHCIKDTLFLCFSAVKTYSHDMLKEAV